MAKEQRWLPRLAPHLPLPIPAPAAAGRPGCGYPWSWSVNRWLDGVPALVAPAGVGGSAEFGRDVAGFLRALGELAGRIDVAGARTVWKAALAATWTGDPVWFHADIAPGNLLVDDGGRLSAVIDFGGCGVGDPACDLVLTWTFLDVGAGPRLGTVEGADQLRQPRAALVGRGPPRRRGPAGGRLRPALQ